MAEPAISPAGAGIVAVAITLVGPLAGPYAVIVLSALAGALWALASSSTSTRFAGAILLLRLVLSSLVLTGVVAWWVESQYGWPAHHMLAPIAFAIAMGGDRWRGLAGRMVDVVARRISGGQGGGS